MTVRELPPEPWLPGESPFPVRRGLFLVWKPECHRSLMTARCFNLALCCIWPFDDRSAVHKLARYGVSMIQSLLLLLRRRPDFLVCLNQPPFLVLLTALYGRLAGVPYVLDSHSGAFGKSQWAWFLPLYRWCARHALFNINHNPLERDRVAGWGAETRLIPEIPGEIAIATPPPPVDTRQIAYVCSFAPDEPLEMVFEAARRCPELTFRVTGNHRKAPAALIESRPGNVQFTGFLERTAYLDLLRGSAAVLTLSDRPHIMQMAAEEALCLAVPIVTNRSPVLESSFARGARFVELNADDLVPALEAVCDDNAYYRREIAAQREIRRDHLRALLDEIASFYKATR